MVGDVGLRCLWVTGGFRIVFQGGWGFCVSKMVGVVEIACSCFGLGLVLVGVVSGCAAVCVFGLL